MFVVSPKIMYKSQKSEYNFNNKDYFLLVIFIGSTYINIVWIKYH